MKIAIIGDLHFGVRGDSQIFTSFQRKFFENVFFPVIKKEGVAHIIQLGDFVDRRKFMNTLTMKNSREMFFDKIMEAEHIKGATVLLGNHDIYYRESLSVNAWDEFFRDSYSEKIHCVKSPEILDFDGFKMAAVPWICKENQEEIEKFIESKPAKYLLGHFDIAGHEMFRGKKSEHGYDHSIFAKYDHVYTGHYHTHSFKENIEYLGTPYELTWSDCNDTKGFIIFDTETRTQEWFSNPYRIFHKILYNDQKNDYNTIPLDELCQPESYIRLILQERENEEMLSNFIQRLYDEMDPIDLQITDTTVAYREEDLEGVETKDPLTALIESVNPNHKHKKEIDNLIINLYSEAQSLGKEE